MNQLRLATWNVRGLRIDKKYLTIYASPPAPYALARSVFKQVGFLHNNSNDIRYYKQKKRLLWFKILLNYNHTLYNNMYV